MKVEHPFHILKNLFKHRQIALPRSAKNEAQLFRCSVWWNLMLARKRLMALDAQGNV